MAGHAIVMGFSTEAPDSCAALVYDTVRLHQPICSDEQLFRLAYRFDLRKDNRQEQQRLLDTVARLVADGRLAYTPQGHLVVAQSRWHRV